MLSLIYEAIFKILPISNGTLSLHLKFVRYRRGDIRAAVKHSFFSCLGWLGQKQISAYISQYQHQICCMMAYSVRK